MDFLKTLIKDVKAHELLVSIVLIFYILTGVTGPNFLADFADTSVGTITIVVISCILAINVHRLLGALILVSAYELLKRSGITTGKTAMMKYLPSEDKKNKTLTAMNQFPVTLEEEVVHKMAPFSRDLNLGTASYKPVLNDDVGGSKIQ